MVLKVLADTRQVVKRGDPQRRQLVRRTDAGQQQQLGRIERPAGEDHLAVGQRALDLAVLLVFDPDRPPLFQQDAMGESPGLDFQVGPAPYRVQEAGGGRGAPAVVDGELGCGEPLGLGAVEIVEDLVAQRLGRLDQPERDHPVGPVARNAEFAARAMEGVLAAPVVLALLEVRQHLRVAPALHAELAPVVVVDRMAPRIHHAVHGR